MWFVKKKKKKKKKEEASDVPTIPFKLSFTVDTEGFKNEGSEGSERLYNHLPKERNSKEKRCRKEDGKVSSSGKVHTY